MLEIFNKHVEQVERQHEEVPFGRERAEIRRVGIEHSGTNRAYCAFFQPDGTVTYRGHGKGLEGTASGKADVARLALVLRFLESLDPAAFATDYSFGSVDIVPHRDAFIDVLLLIETRSATRTLLFNFGAMPPQFLLVMDTLDLLLDSAEWDKHGFFIQRDLSVKPSVKRKWG